MYIAQFGENLWYKYIFITGVQHVSWFFFFCEFGKSCGTPFHRFNFHLYKMTPHAFVAKHIFVHLLGLIIDAFGELRDQQEQVKEDMEVRSDKMTDIKNNFSHAHL